MSRSRRPCQPLHLERQEPPPHQPFLELARAAKGADKFWYVVVWCLGSLQHLVLAYFVRQPVWRSFNGVAYTPVSMSDRHLVNTIRFIERNNARLNPIYPKLLEEQLRRGI